MSNPVRVKRLKYLTTRDQVCPNCVKSIGKCQDYDISDSDVPVIKARIDDIDEGKIKEFCKNNGYLVVTEYTIKHFKGDVK